MSTYSEGTEESTADRNFPLLRYLLPYIACYCLVAAVSQAYSEIPPWEEGAPIDYFTAGLLWILSLISLLMADSIQPKGSRSWLWLAASAGLALLAIDEHFELHEHTEKLVGDDDHIKVLQWFAAGFVLNLIDRFEDSSLRTKIPLLIGFIAHGLYVFVDIGDGGYFRIPFVSVELLKWMEEFLELFALSAYCVGLLSLYTGTRMAKFARNE